MAALLLSTKEELKDVTHENQREMEGLLDNVRHLTKELALQEAIEDIFIPDHYKVMTLFHFVGLLKILRVFNYIFSLEILMYILLSLIYTNNIKNQNNIIKMLT